MMRLTTLFHSTSSKLRNITLITLALLSPGLLIISSGSAASADSPLSIQVDSRVKWIDGLDSTIQRIVTLTNTGPSGIFRFDLSQPTNPDSKFMGVCTPQPNFLFLPSGSSGRIICSVRIGDDIDGSQDWKTGTTHQAKLRLAFTLVTWEGQPTPLQTVDLDNSIYVQQRQNKSPNTPMAKPNATLSINTVDAKTGRAINGANLQISNSEAGWMFRLNSGGGKVPINAHKRGVLPAWQPYTILAQARGYADLHVAVSPVAGRTTTVRLAMRPPTLTGKYKLIGQYNAIAPIGRGAISADGRFLVTVPFAESVPPRAIVELSQLDFFDVHTGKLLWKHPLGVLAMPSVDISADGQYVAMIDPGSNFDHGLGVGQYPALTLLNHQGQVVWSIPALDQNSATIPIGGGPVAVKFSPDGRYLAYGNWDGRLVILNRLTGAVLSQAFLGGQVRNIAWSAEGSRIYASSGDNNVYALNSLDASVIWKTDVGGWALFWAVSTHEILLTAKTGYALTMLRTNDGAILWQNAVMSSSDGIVISPDEKLEATTNATGTNIATAVYDKTGRLLWASAANSNAVAMSGSKFVLFQHPIFGSQGATHGNGNSDYLTLYVASTGEIVWSVKLPGPPGDWGHGEAGYVYISPDAKTIIAGGAETGRVYFYRGAVTKN